MPKSGISPAAWSAISALLDEALDLDPDARCAWMLALDATHPQLAPIVRRLLAAHATRTADLLRWPHVDADARDLEPDHAAGARIGPYRLIRELGRGGMADVWLAQRADGAFERDVALKLPRVTFLRRDLALRFAQERDILARLEHPHIARFYDAGITREGLPYLAMEYVDGQPITRWCDEHRLGIAARIALFTQVLDAVQFAHSSLIVHRDLKPSNILVTADGQIRLLDFGIAKLVPADCIHETQRPRPGTCLLTPDYASPEQVRGTSLTIATDVYSLGVVLYELLCGQLPYRLLLRCAAPLEQAILANDIVRPSSVECGDEVARRRAAGEWRLARSLRGDLDAIVLKALAQQPAQRYATVAELAEDLRRHNAGRPVHAHPHSWSYRARKFVVRNRGGLSAAAAIGAALIAALLSLWEVRQDEAGLRCAPQPAAAAHPTEGGSYSRW